MKDVGKLFKSVSDHKINFDFSISFCCLQMLSIVSGIANYFGKSNYGTHHLGVERQKEGVSEGIKSHSDTRFSSSYYQVVSVNSCMNAIKRCVQSGTLKFDTAAVRFFLLYNVA